MRRKTKFSTYPEQIMKLAQAFIIRKFRILLLNMNVQIPSYSNFKLAAFT
jgi:hypothetical protein